MNKLNVLPPRQRQPDPDLVLLTGHRELALILAARGITRKEQILQILNPLATPEPDLADYPPVGSAITRILTALEQKEQITIYGDYDVDGITATSVLVSALRTAGGQVNYHIPNRFSEGYGMHADRVRALAAAGTNLIITCDCGISNAAEVALARDLGMDVIVTDHHTPPEDWDELFAGVTVLNFKLLSGEHPSRELPGVGIAFILMRCLLTKLGKSAEDLLDLVALGIIADVVPLVGHNRQLLKIGLPSLLNANRPGVQALFNVAGLSPGRVDEEVMAFQVIPRLNAAGRLDDGGIGVELLLAPDNEQALPLAQELNQLNQQRKDLGKSITQELTAEAGKPLIAYGADWHQGVIGISAGQICNTYQIPVALMTSTGTGLVVGSARSVPGIDIYQAIKDCSQHLDKFGGHPSAAGFSLQRDKLSAFKTALTERLQAELERYSPPPLEAELELRAADINLDLLVAFRKVAPFGEANPRPLCLCKRVRVWSIRKVNGGHILTVGEGRQSFTAGLWRLEDVPTAGSWIRMAVTLSEDYFREKPTVRATVLEWWPEAEAPAPEVEVNIIDMRGQGQQALDHYPGAALFREGLDWLENQEYARNQVQAADTLLMLTPPASEQLFRQLAARAERVVLAFSREHEPVTLSGIFASLLAAIKYSINKHGGKAALIDLAAAMGLPEELVLEAVKQLARHRVIDFQLLDGVFYFERGESSRVTEAVTKSRLLTSLLGEVNAYMRWLRLAALTEIEKIQV
ncbi:MAG: single-stranded-DNA-specific exonuclease RecJ [Firmicutes bacterium]|nr:single-stranded-DNA-specific exonuclease RecJ [Bacillota bacterium]